LAETARRNLIRAESHWDEVMSDLRTSEYMKDQADMDKQGRFTYRTTAGARFPRIVDRSDLNIIAATDDSERASLHTNFSSWVGLSRFNSFEVDDDSEYSTDANASREVYDKREISAFFSDPQLKIRPHSSERLSKYGIDTHMVTLRSNTVPALISSGRRVPNKKSESKSKTAGTYKLTIELEDVEVSLSSNDVSVCKIVLSVYVNPKLNLMPVTLTEFFDAGEDKLTIVDPFMVTIIPKMLPGGQSLFRATGMPVIPRHVPIPDVDSAVAIIKAKDHLTNVDHETITVKMNDALRDTDQWLNITHDTIQSFLTEKPKYKSQSDEKRYSYITKCGVEFDDVEYIEKEFPELFNGLFDFGLEMLSELCHNDREPGKISKGDVSRLFKELFEDSCGPSIVHSEEIRSPNLSGYGVKPVTAPLLLVRMVLSRILIVGIGHPSHNPLNVEKQTIPHHLVNQKRAEAMLIPLSVMKDNLLVYSLSGSVGVYFKDTVFSAKNVDRAIGKSALRKIAKSSFVDLDSDDFDKSGINMLDTLSISALFTVRAPILRVTKDSKAMSDLWFVAPSGLEFDVTPIAMEICHQLSKEMLLMPKNRSVIAWHPLFTIIVGRTVRNAIEDQESRYDVLLLPALRKSTIAKSYHNTTEVLRAVDFDAEVRSHYAAMRDSDAGYVAALRSFVPDV
jgi:hypothetical protein